jgi:hypothetical protein
MKLRGLVPNFYISKISQHINRSQIQECGNCEGGRAVLFLGIFVSKYRYSAFAVQYMVSAAETIGK